MHPTEIWNSVYTRSVAVMTETLKSAKRAVAHLDEQNDRSGDAAEIRACVSEMEQQVADFVRRNGPAEMASPDAAGLGSRDNENEAWAQRLADLWEEMETVVIDDLEDELRDQLDDWRQEQLTERMAEAEAEIIADLTSEFELELKTRLNQEVRTRLSALMHEIEALARRARPRA